MKKLFRPERESGYSLNLGLTMRITFFFLLVCLFKIQANSYSQNVKVSLNQTNTSIEKVFKEIEMASGYRFLYNLKDVNVSRKITLNVENVPLSRVLKELFKNTNVDFEVLNKQIVLKTKKLIPVTTPLIQQKKVKGIITDNNGVPLFGAAILIKGTQKGTSADTNGYYEISVTPGDELVFSYVGFADSTIVIDEKTTTLNVSLKEQSSRLDEVVLVGYSKTRREQFTGAATKIDTKVLQTTQNVSFADALIGVVPGMLVQESFSTPDSPPTILLRGIGSINSSTEPLIIVDGVQMPSGLGQTMLNANDIEDISVLKDAAATSIYGSRGSNGVILITTKRGEREQKLQVQINSRMSVSYPSQSFTSDLMNTQQNLDYGELIGVYNGREDVLAQRRASGNNVLWADLLLKNGDNMNHDIAVFGGTGKANYYSSLSYNGENNLYGSAYNRTVATVKVDYDLFNNVTLGFSGSYGQTRLSDLRTSVDPFGNSFLLNPWEDVYDENGELIPVLKEGTGRPPYNPLFLSGNTEGESHRKNIMGNIYITYTPLAWLTLKGTWGGNFNTSNSTNFEKIVLSGGKLRVANSESENYTANITATIDKNFNDHHLTLLLGSEVGEAESSSFSATARGYLNNKVRTISAATNAPTIFENMTQSGSVSYFSRLDYGYKGLYNVSASIRRDGSSRFGDHNKYANFWSLGAGWNIHNNFFKNAKGMSSLRLRASIGTSGNDFIGDFDALSLYGFRKTYDGVNVPTLSGGANPDLTWEKNRNLNIGLDFGAFNNRISGSVDYYIRDTKDLINDRQISFTSGFSDLTSNIGEFRNQGIEVSLNTLNIQAKDFSWSSTLNFSHNKSKVLELIEDADLIQRGYIAYKKGAVINALYMIDWLGVNPENGLNRYQDAEGNVIEYDTQSTTPNQSELSQARSVSDKTSAPVYFGGFTNNIQYKNVELSFLISFSGGNYVINGGLHELYNTPYLNQHINALNVWRSPGDETDVAVRALNRESDYGVSTQFLQDADYIKLKNLTLAYNFDKDLTKRFGVESLRVFAQGQNLFTITDIDYTDPEYSTLTGGIGLSSSIVRKISLGINVTF
ncbi:SusC/RagA family TonB-linked outer membrane protein [Zhouia spongiae]|uniref:SusC/RagA family TonB-linked outer membrane protein n=1 Tax=Zhouia spongiae TaxID=2202721 RepID=A0ABY3YLP4_9FLAO|nr:SusC/RagA family TonB-linked outer membrane protein [Zhouia spongiae]UNY98760.1 SusC/RagA family TonB-linked outer membrane protein [Zhouia spongiae]